MRIAIKDAFAFCRSGDAGRAALELMERRETGANSNKKPIYTSHRVATIKAYSEHVVSILCYIWRTSEDLETAPYTLLDNQLSALCILKETCADIVTEERGSLNMLAQTCAVF